MRPRRVLGSGAFIVGESTGGATLNISIKYTKSIDRESRPTESAGSKLTVQ